MWDASACVALCATALTQLKHDSLQPREFAAAMALLPETVSLTPQVASWQASATPAFVQRYSDVHALLTSPDQLLTFRQLPYCVVRAWAGSASDSDGLVIDREESVVVALEWWRKGAEGRKCSKAQLKELTGLVRVCHTSAGEVQVGLLGSWCPSQLSSDAQGLSSSYISACISASSPLQSYSLHCVCNINLQCSAYWSCPSCLGSGLGRTIWSGSLSHAPME
jgi:hypothetical protein